MGDPEIGNLHGHLDAYFNGPGAEHIKAFERSVLRKVVQSRVQIHIVL